MTHSKKERKKDRTVFLAVNQVTVAFRYQYCLILDFKRNLGPVSNSFFVFDETSSMVLWIYKTSDSGHFHKEFRAGLV